MGEDIKNTITFTIAKKIKTLSDKLNIQLLYTENYKTLLR